MNKNVVLTIPIIMGVVEKSGNEYVNRVIDRIPNVSQSWTP